MVFNFYYQHYTKFRKSNMTNLQQIAGQNFFFENTVVLKNLKNLSSIDK